MLTQFFVSMTAFSLMLSTGLSADSEGSQRKRPKAHYAGVRAKPPAGEKSEKRRSTKIKNEWVASKTHPKETKKAEEPEVPTLLSELPEDRPSFMQTANQSQAFKGRSTSDSLNRKVANLEEQVEQLKDNAYPKKGIEAPRGHAYVTGEWLYLRARQEGMEYATAKKVNFDFTSGFRVGLGAHLPLDGWDIYANYTRFVPEHTNSVAHTTFPLFLYGATDFVTDAHAHWRIEFQCADLEIGRAFWLSKTLGVRPYFGLKGAWIDQKANVRYTGGFIPEGQEYSVHYKNDFKGAGPRIGCQTHWDFGCGFSFVTDAAAALIIGQFNNDQTQHQLDGFEPIDLNTNFHLVSPNLQLMAGLAWDRNYCHDHCHFGISAGFESQIYWSQNQTELFTTVGVPIYVRQDGDFSFYGLSLKVRFDF